MTYSIIIPVYNVEKYLPACLDSILAQETTSSYEVILVDDGSPDGSGAICDRYAAQYENICVIHRANGGVSAARNTGIEAATGEYVLFCDPDDFYADEALSRLDAQISMRPDMVVFSAKRFDEKGNEKELRPVLIPTGECGKEVMTQIFQREQLFPVAVWQYLYRRKFLVNAGLFFRTDLRVAEDFDFNFRAIACAESVCGLAEPLYFYRVHSASVSRKPNLQNFRSKCCVCAEYFRKYPTASLANIYYYWMIGCSAFGSHRELREIIRDYKKNQGMVQYVTERRAKLASVLFRLFGLYYGSALIMAVIRLRHRFKERRAVET